MSTIEVRAKAIQSQLVDQGRKKASMQLVQRLTALVERGNRTADHVLQGVELTENLRGSSVNVPSLNKPTIELAKKARASLRRTATRFETPDLEDAAAIQILDGPSVQRALTDSDTVVDRIADAIAKGLRNERDALLPEHVDEAIPELPGKSLIAARLRQNRDVLKREIVVNAAMLTSEGVEQIQQDRAARSEAAGNWNASFPELVEALKLEHPEFQEFLQAASTPEGASLALLTEAVRTRLEQNEMFDDYRIHRR